jgi:hypothetical protein
MSAYVNMGDKVNAGSSVAGAITLTHQQNVFSSDAVIPTTGKVFTITSPLIDNLTIPVVSCQLAPADTGAKISVAFGALTPTAETLNSGGFAASITPGTLVFTLTAGTITSLNPLIGVCFL